MTSILALHLFSKHWQIVTIPFYIFYAGDGLTLQQQLPVFFSGRWRNLLFGDAAEQAAFFRPKAN